MLTKRSLKQIAGDAGSAEWTSSKKVAGGGASSKNDWLADSIAKADAKKARAEQKASKEIGCGEGAGAKAAAKKSSPAPPKGGKKKLHSAQDGVVPDAASIGRKAPMPHAIRPMLATLVDKPFDSDEWLYEVKWDGYRAVSFLDGKSLRLVSRNQNDLTAAYPELHDIPNPSKARTAILDGEIVALDEEGRPSFSLMQQRTGVGEGGRRIRRTRDDIPVVYYVFDLLYLDGYDLTQVDLEVRKQLLASIVSSGDLIRYSDHYVGQGTALFQAAAQRGLEGIVAKRRTSCYVQKRSSEWLKIKVVRRQECVIGGYTDPRGARENFGSLVLGLYDDKGPADSGGTGRQRLHRSRRTSRCGRSCTRWKPNRNPFFGKVESDRRVHFVKPELVAEIKFTEWTHEGQSGGIKMRAPVFPGIALG